MFTIRRYQKNDAAQVGILIADTYGNYNLSEMTPEQRAAMLGPFAFARSSAPEHREAIADAIEAPSVWVAEQGGEIVGVLRGGRVDHRGAQCCPACSSAGIVIGRASVGRWWSSLRLSTLRRA